MDLKSNIQTGFTKKTLSIAFILFFVLCLFVFNAFAGGCYCDEGCSDCRQMDHRRATGVDTGFMPYADCQPQTPKSACGITTSRIIDSQNFLVSSIKVNNHNDSIIPVSQPVNYGRYLFSESFLLPFRFSVLTASAPIYLLNLSLLC